MQRAVRKRYPCPGKGAMSGKNSKNVFEERGERAIERGMIEQTLHHNALEQFPAFLYESHTVGAPRWLTRLSACLWLGS